MRGHLTGRQLAMQLGISNTALANWRKRATGPRFTKIGSTYYYPVIGVNRWLNENSPEGPSIQVTEAAR